jgi:pimeloyl-ACP methyl ester carboxylesterase
MNARFLPNFLLILGAVSVGAAESGIRLEEYPSPYSTRTHRFESQGEEREMVYMDVAPAGTAKGIVLLLHGKNFSGLYFGRTIGALRDEGWRVIAPDQVGFGKSSKPAHYHYSFAQLAANTRGLLDAIRVRRVHVLGHSMGGMLAVRLARLYPERVASLTLLNPIGLEDWLARGVPYATVDENLRTELAQTPEKMRTYQRESYYHGTWRPEFEPWLEQLASFLSSPDYPRMAWNQALTSEMILTQPVVHDFPQLRAPTLLLIGTLDRTAIGKDRAPPEVKKQLGDYPALARAAAASIPNVRLIFLEGLGHLPHVEDFEKFFPPYLDFLRAQPGD